METELAKKQIKLAEVKSQLSNPEKFVEDTLTIASNLHVCWQLGDYATKYRIQKTVFPKGILIDPVKRIYLTRNINPFFKRLRYLSVILDDSVKEKVGKNADHSSLVAGAVPITIGIPAGNRSASWRRL